ncbi:hypothetical protein GCM10010350_69340 [Streptomyces galilaeus]|nr:hypothetical protein GCM10010350_69340 [Streptomyces galilaeus]
MISRVMEKAGSGAGAGVDDAHAWNARLGWAYGLIAEDPADRAAALVRLADAQRSVNQALGRFNELWRAMVPLGRQAYQDPAFLRAHEEYIAAGRYVLPNALWNRPPGDIRVWPGLPYALLFLEWEARYPRDWTLHAKKWGTKQLLIRNVAVAGHDDPVRTKLTDLVEIAVQRPYRCKDREYVRIARAVDSQDLRGRLSTAAQTDNPWARRQAGYVLWLLDHPELPNTLHVWRTWTTRHPDGSPDRPRWDIAV